MVKRSGATGPLSLIVILHGVHTEVYPMVLSDYPEGKSGNFGYCQKIIKLPKVVK